MESMWSIYLFVAIFGCISALPSNSDSNDRIIGGEPMNITEAPWQVSVMMNEEHHCGGFIIGDRWIVTYITCVAAFGLHRFHVRAGSSYKSTGGEVIFVAEKSDRDQIALLYLSDKLELSDKAKPIKLPDFGDGSIPVGTFVNTSGWGLTEDPNVYDHLRGIEIPIVHHGMCKRAYYEVNREIRPEMLCAGDFGTLGKTICVGDIGGALTRIDEETNEPIAIAVTGGSHACALEHMQFPAYFERIAPAREWIHSITGI